MDLKHIREYSVNESDNQIKANGITLTEDQIKYLNEDGVGLAVKINKIIKNKSRGNANPCISNKMWGTNSIRFSIDLGALGVSERFQNLEKYSNSSIIPSYQIFSSLAIFQYVLDSSLKSGEYKIAKLDFSKREIRISINFETVQDIARIMNESIKEAFDEFKKVRVFIDWELKKISDVSSHLKKEIKTIYSNMIDQFMEEGKIEGSDIDETLHAILLADALEKNQGEIEKFNSLPEKSRKDLLSGWDQILKSDDFTISLRKIEALRKYISVKKSWDFI